MANLKNWSPDMSLAERLWFDKCPKAVLFEIARQFGMRIADDFTTEGAFAAMAKEWDILHSNGIVPQKSFDADKEISRIVAYRESHGMPAITV